MRKIQFKLGYFKLENWKNPIQIHCGNTLQDDNKNSLYSGSCRNSGNNYHSCIAKRSQKKSVNVILNHLNGNQPECRTVEIDEHLECQCGCGKSQSDCKSIQVCLLTTKS